MFLIKRLIKYVKGYLYYFRRKKFPTKKEKLSRGEALITSYLKYSNVTFEPQYPVCLPELGTTTNMVFIDFMVYKSGQRPTALEFNGRQHYEYVPFFHKGGIADLYKQQKRDKAVEAWCTKNDIKFVEIPYTYSADQIIEVLKENFG